MSKLCYLGENPRLHGVLDPLQLPVGRVEKPLDHQRILFAVAVDEAGPDPAFYAFLRRLRTHPGLLEGSIGALVVDGCTEYYTKAAAQELVLAANQAGCLFPGKPLVEGTGSLYNQHIQARKLGLSWEETYARRVRELADRLETFEPPRFRRPRVLMLHASEQARSNTLALGRALCRELEDCCDIREVQLLNGAVYDCRGCGYETCLHFSEHHTCFYGGVVAKEVLPAVRQADLLLFLCPNYNDALGANLVALINRMTALVVQQDLGDSYVAGVVVSGYSGGDLVARQLLGAMNLNRGCVLPPEFCLLQTANDPGDAMRARDMQARIGQVAQRLKKALLFPK